MPTTTLADYLLVLILAAAVDFAIYRWRRQYRRPEAAAGLAEQAAVQLKSAYGQVLLRFRQRWPILNWQPVDAAGEDNPNRPLLASVPAASGAGGPGPDQGQAPTPGPAGEQTDDSASAANAPAAMPGDTPAKEASVVAPPAAIQAEVARFAGGSSAASATASSTMVPVRVTSQVTGETADGLARLAINVEMPVGATFRLTIETNMGAEPTIIQEPITAAGTVAAPPRIAQPAWQPARPEPAPATPASALLPAAPPAPGRTAAPIARLQENLAAAWRASWSALRRTVAVRVNSLPQALFWGGVGIYLVTRLIGLEQYPIYFFTDESVHTVLAADFVHSGLRNSDHEFLPTYFSLGPSYNLNGVSVYLQVIPYLLFGKSEYVTRATSALVTLIAAIAVGLILRDIFKRRYWWTATLLLSVTPAWFLHSRTAFEYIEVASFYAGFLYCYLRYRYISPRSLYGVVLFGALAFYTHGLGEVLMGITTVLLGLADWRYHWQQRATVGRALALGLLLALPYGRYALAHPGSSMDELRQRGTYWVQTDLSFGAKLSQFLSEYAIAFSPTFWFLADNRRDIERHLMDSYGNLWLPMAPLLALGLLNALRHLRESAHRTMLIALAAAPVGSALVAIGIPRVLWEIVPIVVLSALGLSLALEWLDTRRVPAQVLSIGVFTLLAGFNLYLLRDALVNGGIWSRDYTLAGTQYGARQVFGEAIPKYLDQHPDTQFIVSSTWANGTDMFPSFFLTPAQLDHVQLQSLDYFLSQKRDLQPNLEVVLPAYEYIKATQNPKLDAVAVDEVLPYPNGRPGFYFVRLAYSSQANALFASEHEQLLQPIIETILFDGQNVTVTHPRFGAGQLHDMLDGDRYTLINAPGFNPVVLDFAFPAPKSLKGVTLITGSLPDFTVSASVYATADATPQTYSQQFVGLAPDPTVKLQFGQGPGTAVRLRLEIKNNADNGPGVNIHVREVQFN